MSNSFNSIRVNGPDDPITLYAIIGRTNVSVMSYAPSVIINTCRYVFNGVNFTRGSDRITPIVDRTNMVNRTSKLDFANQRIRVIEGSDPPLHYVIFNSRGVYEITSDKGY